MSSERDLADLLDVERHLDEATETTWSGETAPILEPTLEEDAAEIASLLGQQFHSYRAALHLGSGSCAHVFRGDHLQLSRSVAIKVLKPRFLGARVVVQRMRREAEVLMEIRHANIVECFELGSLPNGLPFLILELLPGPTLLERIERDGPLAPDFALAIARQVALGLSILHDRGVVHRDLKASNLMLAGDRVKITDLGILLLEGTDATRLTIASRLLGTRAYMAPEQRSDPRSVTPAADVYALGVVLFAMITGRLPEHPRRALQGALGAAIERMLDPDPARRPSARELSLSLGVAKGKAVPRWPWIGVAALLLLALAFVQQRGATPPSAPVIEAPGAIDRVAVEARPIAREPDPASAAPVEPKPRRERRPALPKTEAPRAVTPADPPLETNVTEPLETSVKRIDREDLERRLSRAMEALRSSASSLPKRDLDAVEVAYFSLRRSLAAAETNRELELVARGVHDLERDVRRLVDRDGTVAP